MGSEGGTVAVDAAHIVLAEDEPMIGRILDFKLGMEGHRVSWVRSAAAAERLVAAGGVDLLLSDITLEEDGCALCVRVLQGPRPPRAGVVLMPEQRDTAAQERARQAGAAALVLKPFKPTVVAATLRALLEARPV
ncbi:MAG TPA: response regulator, partial [Candidatus Dormibacteraeota bacterium]|nr:response regulator [Candidatus Dormibacteraeota bacterium]